MAGRLKLALAASLLMAASQPTSLVASLAAAQSGSGTGGGFSARPLLMQATESEQPPPAPSAMDDAEPEERPARIARPPAPASRPAAVRSPAGQPFLDVAPVETSQLLWIIIALLAIVGLAMSRLGRLKTAAGETFELETQPPVRSKVEAALDAALSAQSGPVRAAPATVRPAAAVGGQDVPTPPATKIPARFDLPLVVHDPRPRFGKR